MMGELALFSYASLAEEAFYSNGLKASGVLPTVSFGIGYAF